MSTRYHYIITLTWSPRPNVSTTFTGDGHYYIEPGTTRRDVYHHAIQLMRQVKVIPDDAVIFTNFFALELDELPQSPSPAVSTPAGEAARPGPPRSGDERGPGRASNSCP